MIRFLPFTCVLYTVMAFASLLLASAAHAQAAGACPTLAADSGLSWKQLDGPTFTFCKAIRSSDGSEAFAVTISKDSPFRAHREYREERAVIDGHEVQWYRSKVLTSPNAMVRETVIELAAGRVAHISLQAGSPEQLTDALKQVEGIRFQGKQLGSN